MTKDEVFAMQFFGTSLEWRLFLGAAVLGMLLGAVFDMFRALRLTVRHNSVAVFFEDLAFTLLFGLSCYTFCTALCRGQIRIFVFLAAAGGFFVYIATLGRLIVRFNTWVVKFAKKGMLIIGKVAKKIPEVLCGVPFFQKREDKIEENPCTDANVDV